MPWQAESFGALAGTRGDVGESVEPKGNVVGERLMAREAKF